MRDTSKLKKFIVSTSAALLIGSITPTLGESLAVEAATHVQADIKSSVNFRTSPSLASGKYDTIPRGATVKVLQEVNQHWLKVEYRGKKGYISAQQRFVAYSSGQAATPETSTNQSWERKADQIIRDGLSISGAPYLYGARAGSGYYDCSLFTQLVYRHNGINLPRNSRQQYNHVDKIKTSQLRKGDLVFFDTKQNGRIDHVAIYMGGNKLLHTYKVGIGVTETKVNSYWKSRYVGAGRVIK